MKMTEDQFQAIVLDYIDRAKQYSEGELGRRRALAYDYYISSPFGNETEGRSQIIDATVASTVDSAVPAIVKTFVSSDRAVEFTPRGAEDVEAAEQATEGANYVFFSQNNGFALVHDCVKDGLLQVTGMFRWCWDENEKVSEETYMGLDDMTFAMVSEDPMMEIVAHSEGQVQMPSGEVATVHNVQVKKKEKSGKVKVYVIPPEEQLISPDSPGVDVYEHRIIGHRCRKTISELVEMGYKKSELEDVASATSDNDFSETGEARANRLLTLGDDDSGDPSQRRVDYVEAYILIDRDGDGIAERRRVCVAGEKILMDEQEEHIPFSYWSPKVMPHEPVGMSLAEEVMDLQYTKSMLLRNVFDSLYLSINPRMTIVEGQVNIDDVLTVRPGGLIRMAQPGMVNPIVVPFVGQQAFPVMEYLDAEGEQRTGISRLFQGLDPNSLNKTATGVNALMNAAQARIELCARNFAENALRPMFRGIMYLLAQNQQKPLMVRLRNKWTPIDPRVWENEYDMTVNVGLGTGTKDQQLQHLMAFGQFMQAVGASPYGQQLVQAKNVYNYGEKLANLSGFKDVNVFLTDPEKAPPPPPQKPPQAQAAEIQAQTDMKKLQAQQQGSMAELQAKGQLEQQKMAQEASFRERELQQEAELERYKADLKAHTDLVLGKLREEFATQREAMRPQEGFSGE